MLKGLVTVGVVVAALGVAPAAQALPFLAGGFSLSSVGAGSGLSPLIPVSATGATLSSFIGATALDFTSTGFRTSGIAGQFKVDGTSLDFNVLYGLTGTIRDFTFFGAAQADFPVPPVTGFEDMTSQPVTGFEVLMSPVFSFDLQSVRIEPTDDPAHILTLTGTGLFHLVGYEVTPGSFYFSGNEAGGTFSYSASEAAVPEPSSMMLLGIGLFGLAGAVRRRMTK